MSDSQVTGVHQIAAALLVDAGKVFLCRRSPDRHWYPNVWDLPGGHIEDAETPALALVRELDEELGILIPEPRDAPFAHLRRADFDCRIWIVREWLGTPHIASEEHVDMSWWSPSETVDLTLAVEDYRLLFSRAV